MKSEFTMSVESMYKTGKGLMESGMESDPDGEKADIAVVSTLMSVTGIICERLEAILKELRNQNSEAKK